MQSPDAASNRPSAGHTPVRDPWDPSPFRHFAAKLAGKPGWEVTTMKVGHDIMVDMPQELAEFLLKLA